ncbi:hypothetical protein I656_01974 [Geobacillus sp. WSUCF1]|nr:hypothetical protein I656_01974 [Geobacillus sp. WSUCF1]
MKRSRFHHLRMPSPPLFVLFEAEPIFFYDYLPPFCFMT